MARRERRPSTQCRHIAVAAVAVSLSFLLVLEFGAGCALFGGPQPVPPLFERIAVRTTVDMTDEGELEGDLHGDTTVKGAAIGLGTGAIGGGGAGFWVGTATCAPAALFYGICVALVTVAGVVIGGIGGMVVGGTTGLPWKAAGEVNEVLAELQRERSFDRDFAAAVRSAIPAEKQLRLDVAAVSQPGVASGPRSDTEAIVLARLDEVDLRQHMGQRMSLRVLASITQEWESDGGELASNICRYEYTSPTHDVEDWLLNDGKAFDDYLTEGMSSIARWMARDLEAFRTRTARPETDGEPATCFQGEV
jgi:hypothetical protein